MFITINKVLHINYLIDILFLPLRRDRRQPIHPRFREYKKIHKINNKTWKILMRLFQCTRQI